MMSTKHFAKLEEAIDNWLDQCCEKDGQVAEYYVGHRLTRLMAEAARSVFDASEDGQEFAAAEAPIKHSQSTP